MWPQVIESIRLINITLTETVRGGYLVEYEFKHTPVIEKQRMIFNRYRDTQRAGIKKDQSMISNFSLDQALFKNNPY